MKRTIRPATVLEYRSTGKAHTDVFCRIEIENGKLSISGVVGPRPNGDAWGSCGQIGDSLKNAEGLTLAPGWSPEMFARFLEVWDRWHLNDMRPNCEHQRGPEWDTSKKLTVETFTVFPYTYQREKALSDCKDAEQGAALGREVVEANQADKAASGPDHFNRRGRHMWTPEQREQMDRFASVDKTEEKTAGWITPEQHPEGLLMKPCPVCGYRYGSAWLREELPGDVLEFLTSLPEADKTPAWV